MFKDAFNKKKYFSIKPEAESLHKLPEALTEKLPGGKTCPQCLSKINEVEYLKSFKVCPSCGHHFTITAWERVRLLADENSFREFDHNLRSCNFLEFSAYEEKLSHAAQESGLNEAIITGYASISGYKAVLGIMESRFMMAVWVRWWGKKSAGQRKKPWMPAVR
jgi:acetyl-CoA carboxylase carboxyl transferase subunit beta